MATKLRTVEYKDLTEEQKQRINQIPEQLPERAVSDEIRCRRKIEIHIKKEVKDEVFTDDDRRKTSDGKKLAGECGNDPGLVRRLRVRSHGNDAREGMHSPMRSALVHTLPTLSLQLLKPQTLRS